MTDTTGLSSVEIKWILEKRVTRLTDKKEVQIYPMGAERYLASALTNPQEKRYDLHYEINKKNVLIIPGHGNSSFLFALAGAQSVTVYDKDPVTIAWVKAFKKYYHYKKAENLPTAGELLHALTSWYPPSLHLGFHSLYHRAARILSPNTLRRIYLHYLISVIQHAVQSKKTGFELDKIIDFKVGSVENLSNDAYFDTAFIPYLLGVGNGIEKEQEMMLFMTKLMEHVQGPVLVTPSRAQKEFYLFGVKYLQLSDHENIQSLPFLSPFFKEEDSGWFRTQGLSIFQNRQK